MNDQYDPGEIKNHGHTNDPVVADMLVCRRRTLDPAKCREILYAIRRHLANQQYYVRGRLPFTSRHGTVC